VAIPVPAAGQAPHATAAAVAFASFSSDMDLLGDSDAVLSTQSFGSRRRGGSLRGAPRRRPTAVPLVSQQPLSLSFASLSPPRERPKPSAEPAQKGGLTAQDYLSLKGCKAIRVCGL